MRTTPIVILTGAGISRESGLHTFRDPDGIWAQVRVEDVATPEAFERNPEQVHAFYNARRRALLGHDIKPNAAHGALAKLAEDWPDEVTIVTQNIDNLHERAGSDSVIHMHGEILKARCVHCGYVGPRTEDLSVEEECPECGAKGALRPNVVWFGEVPLFMERIEDALNRCGLFISVGTSGTVYPAAGFVQQVRMVGEAHTVELNMEPSQGASLFGETIYGPASEFVPRFVDRLLAKGVPAMAGL